MILYGDNLMDVIDNTITIYSITILSITHYNVIDYMITILLITQLQCNQLTPLQCHHKQALFLLALQLHP